MKNVKQWTDGVSFDANAQQQVANIAQMSFIHKQVVCVKG